MFARLATSKAEMSSSASINNTVCLREKLMAEIDSLHVTEKLIDTLFGRYPYSPELRLRISNGKMLLREGCQAFRDSDFLSANTMISDAGYLLSDVYDNTLNELKDYFKAYPEWTKLVKSAINESAKNKSYSIIIDKISKKCYLYFGGLKKYEFDAELGRNWIGTKRAMGDKATPEGLYRIVRKYQANETPYHKSLAIDYPNKQDQDRFKKELANGSLPQSSKIGSGIEIHGEGGKGVDWTDGCIALINSEIDILFSLANVGTPVTIVGSVRSYDEIIFK
jgi:murein L,D-transpeptidase YafK